MTIRVKIGADERDFDDIEPNWISEQIVRREQDGVPVCVVVVIKSNDLDMVLSSGGCQGGGGGGRPPNPQESQIFNLWEKHHLNDADISPGELIAFLNQIK